MSERSRLDQYIARKGWTQSRSQAENFIRLGKVRVDGHTVTKPGFVVGAHQKVVLQQDERYVSRAGLKLASVAQLLNLDFREKTVLDVGSSTGGFTDYALQHGAKKVFAVDVGTKQLHDSLRGNKKIELHEKTDIRDITVVGTKPKLSKTASRPTSIEYASVSVGAADVSDNVVPAISKQIIIKNYPDIIVIDVSFISLREVLPHIATLATKDTQIVAMLKPQFEAGREQVNKGVIKNDAVRRKILKEFELWAKRTFVVADKRDSEVSGAKGNQERFYLLKKL